MTHRFLPVLAAAAFCLVITGCTQSVDGSAGTVVAGNAGPSAGGSVTADAAPPIDPCEGTTGCQYVADVDVDGDGATDQVGIAYGPSGVQVVAGINGERYEWVQPASSGGQVYTDPAEIYRGAFALSRAQGADIALHLVQGGGNAEQFAVVSWDGSGLVALPQPPTADRTGLKTEGIWYLGSSHGRQDSIACRAPGELTVNRLTAATQEGSPVPGGGRREENYYLFSGGQWQPNGSDNVPDTTFSYSWDAHANAFACDDLGVAP
ncbi:hypothetical protein [Williamsia sp. 1135]|uniref:hypothetical protein n=1 Tax=Williamsia sp. 1135 TaxID=1889262 RepID=UPI000A109B86|nr:hypothetical protein [Williamsia sp. 1135]ORM37138.1 hypothetical protein BFL43_05085 [Williamsia sp. 1135]